MDKDLTKDLTNLDKVMILLDLIEEELDVIAKAFNHPSFEEFFGVS